MTQNVKPSRLQGLLAHLNKARSPNLAKLYSRSAQYDRPDRNPVMLIPGLLGSKLLDQDSQANVWGVFSKKGTNPQTPEGVRLLALPMQPNEPLHQIRDKVVPYNTLDRMKGIFFGVPLQLRAYARILQTLGVGGFRDQQRAEEELVDYGTDHYTCFQFAYDWRRDISENARILHQYVLGRRKFVQEKIEENFGVKDYDVKINLIVHSMGGLLARYYLMYGDTDLPADGSVPKPNWNGAKYIEKVIIVGTPNAGSVKLLSALVDGITLGPGLPKYEAALLGTMTSLYEMLPRARHGHVVDSNDHGKALDVFDLELWKECEWGLLNPEQDKYVKWLLPDIDSRERRYEIALEHVAKNLGRAQQFQNAIDQSTTHPDDLTLNLIAADSVPTDSKISVDTASGKIKVIDLEPGDGSVTRRSALLDERTDEDWSPVLQSPIKWNNVFFIFTDHIGLTKHPMFTDNVLYHLLESPDN